MEKKQEGFATYLCVQAPEKGYSFEQQMIEHNRQLMLLSIQKREEEYYFEIQDKKEFLTLFRERSNEYTFIRTVLFGIITCLEQLDDYLLKPDSVMLMPETVFLDADGQVYLCYVPGYEGNIQQEFCSFMEYLMKYIDHKEDNLVVLVYGIYHIVREQQYSLLAVCQFMEEREKGISAKQREEEMNMASSLSVQETNKKADKKVIESGSSEIIKLQSGMAGGDNGGQKDEKEEQGEKREAPFHYQQHKNLIKVRKQWILSVMAAMLLLFAGMSLYEGMFIYHTMAQGIVLPLVAAACLLCFGIAFNKGITIYRLKRSMHKNVVANGTDSEYNRG